MSTRFNDTLGAILLGGIFCSMLYGVTCVQMFIYFSGRKDNKPFKTSIAFLWIFDTIQQTIVIHLLYFYMVLNFANPEALANPVWSIVAQILAATASDTLVRGIYAICIWRLSGKVVLVAIIASLSLMYFGIGAGFTIFQLAGKGKLHFEEINHFAWLLYTALATAAAADACIAAFLCWQLYSKRTGFKSTDSIVKTLITFTINTGLIMTLASTAVFISFTTQPNNFIYIGVFFPTSKLYINSLLASLNARDYVRNQRKSTIISPDAATAGLPSFALTNHTDNRESYSMATVPTTSSGLTPDQPRQFDSKG